MHSDLVLCISIFLSYTILRVAGFALLLKTN